MKYLLYLSALSFCFFFVQCTVKKKVEYVFPPNITETTRQHIIESYEKGKILFKLHCASCHGIYEKGKDSVPNFSKTQIDNYNAMFIKGDPKNHSVAQHMSQEQLLSVLIFLKVRRR